MSIIINADDFGLSEQGDNTIIMLHELGVVSSTTLMANGEDFSRAVDLSKEYKRLGIGVHLCLDGPFNIGKEFCSILDRNTNQFYNLDKILKKLKTFSVDKSDIYKEYCLQIEKVLDHNIHISHLDHHHNLHKYLPALNSMIKAAKKYKIHYIRPQKMLLHKDRNFLKYVYRDIHHLYLKNRLNTVDTYFNPEITDNLHYELHFTRLTEVLKFKNRIIEIMLHPIDINVPETTFYSSKLVLNLLSNQTIINYNDLKV
jgi:predicted glycoside hydrolase/deacetylase ChbG (UPF0249 family)